MLKTYSFRLYPNEEQKVLLSKHFGCVRWVYNWGLGTKIVAWAKDKKHLTRFMLGAELPSCGVSHDRDVNAAKNIKRIALHPQNLIGLGKPESTPLEKSVVNGFVELGTR